MVATQDTCDNSKTVEETKTYLYRQANGNTINFLLSPKVLSMKSKDRPGLINPLEYYQSK